MGVYEDGVNVGVVEVDVSDCEDVKKVLKEMFDCDDDVEYVVELLGNEWYVGISECEYLWCVVDEWGCEYVEMVG